MVTIERCNDMIQQAYGTLAEKLECAQGGMWGNRPVYDFRWQYPLVSYPVEPTPITDTRVNFPFRGFDEMKKCCGCGGGSAGAGGASGAGGGSASATGASGANGAGGASNNGLLGLNLGGGGSGGLLGLLIVGAVLYYAVKKG